MTLLQRSGLEALGTGLLAFTIGRLSTSDLNGFEQAIAIGLCLTLLIHIMGRFSGAHFNPAVTLLLNHQRFGFKALRSQEGLLETGAYVLAQIIGALMGFALAAPLVAGDAVALEGLIPEALLSLVLFALILRWSHEGRICPFAQPLSGLVVGAGLAFLALLGGLTQSGIYNPAIAIGLGSQGVSGWGMAVLAQLLAVVMVLALEGSHLLSHD
ncbi:MAG: aquaporin [Synechococcus sp.]|nr:aquaporin [Synechococcus sp.]